MELVYDLRKALGPVLGKALHVDEEAAVHRPAVVMVGLDNSGKSSLFREMARKSTGSLTAFRKSGVRCRRVAHKGMQRDLINAPDIRLLDDHADILRIFESLEADDTVVLVVRGTDAVLDAARLLELVRESLGNQPVAIVVTFRDKCEEATERFAARCEAELGVPTTTMNARDMRIYDHKDMHSLVENAAPLRNHQITGWEEAEAALLPNESLLENPKVGRAAALTFMCTFFAVTVFLGYLFANWAEGPFMQSLYLIMGRLLASVPDGPFMFLFGSHGEGPLVLMLGLVLWVMPLVIFYAVGHALLSESGIKDRVTNALDPIAREIGLTGRDLLPVMCGYGCKVVGVMESRRSGCRTRKPTISFLAMGTASFFQVSAAGVLFAVLGHYWLITPYLMLLFLVGVVHNRLWYGVLPPEQVVPVSSPSFIQVPRFTAVLWQARATVKEFLQHAMPLFILSFMLIGFCVHFGGFEKMAEILAPVMGLFRLPPDAAQALIWSMARKDIMFALLSADAGGILHTLSVGQVFVLVYFASVFSVTIPTLFIIWRDMGRAFALRLVGTQLATALVSTLVLAYTVIPWF